MITDRELPVSHSTLELENSDRIDTFLGFEPNFEAQDAWIQEQTGEDTAVVSGYTIRTDPLKVEIDYQYIEQHV